MEFGNYSHRWTCYGDTSANERGLSHLFDPGSYFLALYEAHTFSKSYETSLRRVSSQNTNRQPKSLTQASLGAYKLAPTIKDETQAYAIRFHRVFYSNQETKKPYFESFFLSCQQKCTIPKGTIKSKSAPFQVAWCMVEVHHRKPHNAQCKWNVLMCTMCGSLWMIIVRKYMVHGGS